MECFLPSTAFVTRKRADLTDSCDSTKCVEGSDMNSGSSNICDVYTPIGNSGCTDKSHDYLDLPGSVVDNECVKKEFSYCNEVKTGVLDTDFQDVCESPRMTSVDRLNRLKNELSSTNTTTKIPQFGYEPVDEPIDEPFVPVSTDPLESTHSNSGSTSPSTTTPVKSVRSSNRRLDVLNSIIRTRLDEPHVNISDDETKNPILANSVRRTKGLSSNTADVRRSLQVLGSSRCWTDRFENQDPDDDDSVSATQSPVRSLNSLMNSQADVSDSSYRRPVWESTPNFTPIRSISSINRFQTDNSSKGDSLDMFASTSIAQMSRMQFNPMSNVTLTREEMCRANLSGELLVLHKHFQNICTVINRSMKRDDKPYFRVLRTLVQRLSRKSFTMDHLRKVLWLAPNLISVKWVLISESFRKKYPTEYKESTDKVYDITIKILRPDLSSCYNNQDYETACFLFKTILCCWSLKCDSENLVDFDVPMAELPEKTVRSNLSTPIRDTTPRFDTPMRSVTPRVYDTPMRSITARINDTPMRSITARVNDTPMRSVTPMRGYTPIRDTTPVRSVLRSDFPICVDNTPCKTYKLNDDDTYETSSKRMRTDSISPMSVDLLDTPGMNRIRENIKKLAETNQPPDPQNDLKFWIDMRWFTKILLEIIVSDTSPIMKLEFLVDFIVKYGSRKVTQGNHYISYKHI